MMKAALYDGETMHVRQIPRPEVTPDGVIVRVRAAGICGSELNHFRTLDEPQEHPAGHEVAGEIVETGARVVGWAAGDRVALDTICQGKGCGTCKYCLAGAHVHCLNREPGMPSGGFADFIHRKALGCHRLPDHLSWSEGALVEPLAVSVHGLRKGQLRGGESVMVLGCGTIGLAAVAAARALGANQVMATARHKHQGDMALKLGANAVFGPEDERLREAVLDATQGHGADLVVEAVGGRGGETLRQAEQLCRPLGRVVVLGVFFDPIEAELLPLLVGEKDMLFANCYAISGERHDFDVALDILAARRLPLRDLVTHTYPLERAPEALETAYDKSTGSLKVQLTP
jgi:threonine dehydrogenase-like Zn-dependent dehydrogenase